MREKMIELLMQKGFGVEGATIAADHLIENGVTIPVYCKECVHRKERVCFNPYAGMWVGVELKDSDFCSYGERRTHENND